MTETQNLPTTELAIKARFNIELTKAKFNELKELSKKIDYSENNIQWIADFLEKGRNLIKAINSVHKAGKADALKVCNDWDEAKRSVLTDLDFFSQVAIKYTRLCADVDAEKERIRQEENRNREYLLSIENKMVEYSKSISECKTYEQLTLVERVINLDKARAAKDGFGKYSDVARERFDTLTKNISEQKIIIKKLDLLKELDNEENLEKIEEAEQVLEEKKFAVQESVIESISSPIHQVNTTFVPSVKARRTTWKFEIADVQEILKKVPNFLNISLDDSKVKELQSKLKAEGKFEGVKEFTINGIRFFEHKTY